MSLCVWRAEQTLTFRPFCSFIIYRYKARRVVSFEAANTYEKCYDASTKATYFFNPVTGRAFWDKPKLLHQRSLRNPIEIPPPERNFAIMCGACKKSVAKRWCVECKEYYCYADHNKIHKKGKTSNHTCLPTDVCVQCTSQVASRLCLKCKDEYCDACFHSLHKRGQLRLHPFKEITPLCHQCKTHMALTTCIDCNVHLCRVCAAKDHQVRNMSQFVQH